VSCRTVSVMSLRHAATLLGVALTTGAVGASAAHAAFVPALHSPFATSATTSVLAVADADRNATPDVAAGGLRLLRNDGSGRLLSAGAIATLGPVEAVASGDLDGDGRRDFAAIAPGTPRRLLTFTALPIGGYSQTEVLSDAGEASDVAIANVNGDGLADLAITESDGGSNVTVLRNLGGIYVEDSYPANLPAPADLAFGDLTGDGAPDIAVAGGAASVATLVNNGDGTFAEGGLYPAGTSGTAERLALAHIEGDGRLDIVATDSGGPSAVVLLRGSGGGGMVGQGRRVTGLPSPPLSVAVDDYGGDGPPDVVAGASGGRFALLSGDGSFGFVPASGSPFGSGDPAGGAIDDIAAVDMNHDGQPDVVTANRPGSVSVLLNSATGLLQPQPAGIRFGEMPAGAPTRGGSISLRSMRGRVRITRIDLQGPSTFSVDQRGCLGKTLLLRQTCTMHATYTPARKAGHQQALLSVDANAAAVVIPLGATPRPPLVTRLRLAPRRPLAGKRMLLRFRLSEAARTRTLLQQGFSGRRVAGECVALRPSNRRRRPCTTWTTLARTAKRGKVGANLLRLRARADGRPLAVGRYRLGVSATDRFRNRSRERYVKFRIAQAARREK
jgi:hypothetical protein